MTPLAPRDPSRDASECWPAGDHPSRTCYGCHRPLAADAHPRKLYCSVRCRSRMNQHKATCRKRKPRACGNCGGVFVPVRTDTAVYCTRECKLQAMRRRNRPTHRERDQRRYREDEAYRERKRQAAAKTYRKREAQRPGSPTWARAQLEVLRREEEEVRRRA